MKVKNLEKEHYDEVVSVLVRDLWREGYLVGVETIYPKDFESSLSLKLIE